MSSVKLSIIIPCYNHGVYLRESIEAMKDIQSPYAYEVIVVNDGSTDSETQRIMAELEQAGVQVIHQENQGLARARNKGIKAAQGELILPLDADNILLEDYLNFGIPEFEKDPQVGVVYSDVYDFGEKTGSRKVPNFDYIPLFKDNYIDACAIYRKSCWEQAGGYDEHMPVMGYEDWDLWMRMAMAEIRFKHIDKVGFKYRKREASMLYDANRNRPELEDYMFAKPEYTSVRWMHDLVRENEQLRMKAGSMEYRFGRLLLKPARAVQRLLKGKT